jgi:fibronectin-binding autotransporter adhesin
MTAPVNVKLYVGNGQSGVWTDPLNWTNGIVPGAADTALITKSAVLNGAVTVGTLMLLGNETVTVNGQITTLSTNTCDAGGFEVGVDGVGAASFLGAGNGKAAAVLNTAVMKIGQFDGGVGTLNVAGTSNVTGGGYIGLYGQGTLNVTGSGQANFAGLVLGGYTGGAGIVNLSGNAVVNANLVAVGTSKAGAPGGIGTANIAGHATLSASNTIMVNAGSAVNLTGGTMAAGTGGNGVQIAPGGTVSGYGTVMSASHGVTDNGSLASAGGTLVVNGNLSGMGSVQIGAGTTLDLVASKINVPSITFMGTSGTLDLTTGVGGTFAIDGFGSGDQIVMSGIDQANWSGATHVLSLMEHGQVMDKLNLPGVSATAVFSVTPGASGSVIGLMPVMMGVVHH